MQITDFSITNLKGLTVTERLGPNTLITGGNFTGKTARRQGIELALLGYCPGLPSTNPGIFQLASGPFMEVTAAGDGFSAKRTWKKTGKSVEKTEQVTGLPEDTSSLIAMLDATEFLNATGPEKLAMVFRLAMIETEETRESLLAKIVGVEFPDYPEAVTTRDWINAALPYALEQKKFSKQAVERLDKTQQGMEALEAAADAPVIPEGLEDAIKALEASKRPLEARQTAITTLASTFNRAQQRYEADLSAYNRNLEGRTAKQQLVKNRPDVEKRIADTETAISTLGPRKDTAVLQRRLDFAVREDAEAKAAVQTLENDLDQNAEKIASVDKLECCPHCHSKTKGWRKFLDDSLQDRRAEIEKEISIAKTRHLNETEATETLRKELADAVAHNKTLSDLTLELDGNRGKLKGISQAEQDLATEPTAPVAPESPEDTLEEEMRLEQELSNIADEIAEKSKLLAGAQQAKARAATAAQAILAADKARADKVAWDKAVDVLEGAREKMVDDAFAGLLKVAAPVYEGILKTPLVYRFNTMGRMEGTTFIPMTAFSGTEALVATIALQVGLGAKSPARIVIMDEWGRFDPDRKNLLIANLYGMVKAGQIDQWIAIDVTKPVKKHKDITLIEA